MRPFVRNLTLLSALASGACYAPFSEMQGARLVGPKKVEITGYYSSSGASANGESETLYNHYGAAFTTGLSPRVDIRARVERVAVTGEPDDAFTVISAGPKFSLVRDRVALYLPVGFATGADVDESKTFQFHPTLLATATISKSFEINPSVKVLVPFNSDAHTLVAANLGLAIGPNIARWAIRPEIGYLFDPGDSGHAFHYGLGFSFTPGK